MITEHDLDEAIAECLGQRSPNANTAIKLAAFYTIRHELYGQPEEHPQPVPAYSFSAPPSREPISTVIIAGDSAFAEAVRGKDQAEVWPVLEELMQTIKAIYPRLYEATLRELRED